MKAIEVIGAKVHNLKSVDVTIPRDKLVVVTGLSGSGKSSLAFDTIYAEGQRRYMETLSAYARQFMGALERPDVESINGLSPIIAIEQKSTGRNPRSTVGTITEVYDFLRLLYARASTAYSPHSGKAMVSYSDSEIVSLIEENFKGEKVILLAPLIRGRKGHYRELFASLIKRGFTEVRVNGEIFDLNEIESVDRYKVHFIELVIDKVIPGEGDEQRVSSSVLAALQQGKGSLAILSMESGEVTHYSKDLVCPESGLSFAEPQPHTFSFNSPQGACRHCKGLGKITQADIDKIIPNPKLSIAEGGIKPVGEIRNVAIFRIIEGIARKYSFSIHDPIEEIAEEFINLILYGSDELIRVSSGKKSGAAEMISFDGVVSMIEQVGSGEEGRTKRRERFTEEIICPSCRGSRLKEEALYFKIDGKNIVEIAAMEIEQFREWLESASSQFEGREALIASDIVKELSDRSRFLSEVGLGYLSIDRSTRSLSGGESQRIRLATQIGSKLVNVLYILDEPSIGLHQSDNLKLISSLKRLRDEGNSVMVVEHDMETILAADWLVELGPGAGELGGELLFSGPPKEIEEMSSREVEEMGSYTIDYLKGRRTIEIPPVRREGNGKFLTLYGAKGNNLKEVDIKIPLGAFVGISGVSGSGKSSIINQTLVPAISNHLYRSLTKPLPFERLEGLENIDKLIEVDQSPIGRTPRSNPATYTNLFTDIRRLFGETPDAQIRGFKPGRFSFNVKGGRCEECKGAGVKVIEMNFLPAVNVLCSQCNGKRYNPDTLAVKYRGRSINDVLEMTVQQAANFFEAIPSIANRLQAMVEVGLGYVKLGQPSTTLSGGESQRVKLAAELSKSSTGNSLYILDEPTTGLHFEDIRVLLKVLQKLVDQGNSVVVIEHNSDVLKCADWLIDMGPEGGGRGGYIVAEGSPEELRKNPNSVTGKYLW